MAELPVIDFHNFLSANSSAQQKQAVAHEIDQACRTSGFFYLKGHGIAPELIDCIRNTAFEFFEHVPEEEKQRLAVRPPSEGGDSARGYLRSNDAERGSHEALDFYRPVSDAHKPLSTGQGVNKWPSKPDNFRTVVETYIDQMERLGRKVIEAIALALGVDDALLSSRIDKAFWQLRMIRYDARNAEAGAKAGIGEHTDFGILTFLLSDSTKSSLQVLSKSGEWIYADAIEGAFLCNLGDMLSEWTRGAYRSTPHRVIHTSDKPRISIPFFFDPNWDAFIEPVVPLANGVEEQRHKGVRYRDRYVAAIEQPLSGVAALPA